MQNGFLIAQIRTERGLSQRDVAKRLKISLAVYKLYEGNERPMKIDELNTLSNYFKVSLNALLGISKVIRTVHLRDIDYKYLRFSMRYVRKINRVTQKELAKDLHVSAATIAKLEKHPEYMTAAYLHAFVTRFHVSADYICGKTLKKEVL